MTDGRRRDTRQRVFDAIRNNPGITKRDLNVATDINFYTLQYHLITLKENRKIRYMRLGKRYHWVADSDANGDMRNKPILANRHAEIYNIIKNNRGISSTEIGSILDISLSLVSYYTSLLKSQSVIKYERDGKKKHFKITDREPILYSQED